VTATNRNVGRIGRPDARTESDPSSYRFMIAEKFTVCNEFLSFSEAFFFGTKMRWAATNSQAGLSMLIRAATVRSGVDARFRTEKHSDGLGVAIGMEAIAEG
jgi:hypothetical protein